MDLETYLESEDYKMNNQKTQEACVEKYRAYLPLYNDDALISYINSWADLRTYLITNYHTCTTDELKRLFFKEFFEKRDELINHNNDWIVDNLKNLLSFCEGNTKIVFFKEFIEEKLKEHGDCQPHYTLKQYFCKSYNYEIHEYLHKKMNNAKTEFEKREMVRNFYEESRCLSRPMNIGVFLKIREMGIDDFCKDLII